MNCERARASIERTLRVFPSLICWLRFICPTWNVYTLSINLMWCLLLRFRYIRAIERTNNHVEKKQHTTHRTAHTLVWHAALIYIGFYVKHFYLVQSQLNLFIAEIIYFCTFFSSHYSIFSRSFWAVAFHFFHVNHLKIIDCTHSLNFLWSKTNTIIFQIMDFSRRK